MHPAVIIEDTVEILVNELVSCSVKALYTTVSTASTQPVGNLVATYLKNLKVCVVG
jgi:hypothetical protein